MARRRGKNEGSVYRRADGRWCAAAHVGYHEDGRPRKVVRYGKTQAEAIEISRLSIEQISVQILKHAHGR